MKIENIKPTDIEKRSMEIIKETLGDVCFTPEEEKIVLRAIHTSADFDYAENLCFLNDAVHKISSALANGADIVTDTNMAKAGINKKKLESLGGRVHCFMADGEVAQEAAKRGITRAAVCMEKACGLKKEIVFAIGNAPTALLRIKELYEAGKINPAGIVGVPVGFVNVVEAKEQMMKTNLPQIVARGRKGGSNIAAAIINAILYMLC